MQRLTTGQRHGSVLFLLRRRDEPARTQDPGRGLARAASNRCRSRRWSRSPKAPSCSTCVDPDDVRRGSLARQRQHRTQRALRRMGRNGARSRKQPIVLLAPPRDARPKRPMRLGRIGFDHVIGFPRRRTGRRLVLGPRAASRLLEAHPARARPGARARRRRRTFRARRAHCGRTRRRATSKVVSTSRSTCLEAELEKVPARPTACSCTAAVRVSILDRREPARAPRHRGHRWT